MANRKGGRRKGPKTAKGRRRKARKTLEKDQSDGRLVRAALTVMSNIAEINADLLFTRFGNMGWGKKDARMIVRALDLAATAKKKTKLPAHDPVNAAAVCELLYQVPKCEVERHLYDDGASELKLVDLKSIAREKIEGVEAELGTRVDHVFGSPSDAKDFAAAHSEAGCTKMHSHPLLDMALCPEHRELLFAPQ